jgi:hypothetical protein
MINRICVCLCVIETSLEPFTASYARICKLEIGAKEKFFCVDLSNVELVYSEVLTYLLLVINHAKHNESYRSTISFSVYTETCNAILFCLSMTNLMHDKHTLLNRQGVKYHEWTKLLAEGTGAVSLKIVMVGESLVLAAKKEHFYKPWHKCKWLFLFVSDYNPQLWANVTNTYRIHINAGLWKELFC